MTDSNRDYNPYEHIQTVRAKPEWLEKFVHINGAQEEVIVMAELDNAQLPGAIGGTLTQCFLAEDEEHNMALMTQFVPQGTLLPKESIPMMLRLVSAEEASILMYSVMGTIMCSDLYEQVCDLVAAHMKEHGDEGKSGHGD